VRAALTYIREPFRYMAERWRKEAARRGYWYRKMRKLVFDLQYAMELQKRTTENLAQQCTSLGHSMAYVELNHVIKAYSQTADERGAKIMELNRKVYFLETEKEDLLLHLSEMSRNSVLRTLNPSGPIAFKHVPHPKKPIARQETEIRQIRAMIDNLNNTKKRKKRKWKPNGESKPKKRKEKE